MLTFCQADGSFLGMRLIVVHLQHGHIRRRREIGDAAIDLIDAGTFACPPAAFCRPVRLYRSYRQIFISRTMRSGL